MADYRLLPCSTTEAECALPVRPANARRRPTIAQSSAAPRSPQLVSTLSDDLATRYRRLANQHHLPGHQFATAAPASSQSHPTPCEALTHHANTPPPSARAHVRPVPRQHTPPPGSSCRAPTPPYTASPLSMWPSGAALSPGATSSAPSTTHRANHGPAQTPRWSLPAPSAIFTAL